MPVERLRELFDYDPETGVLTWLVSRTRKGCRVGDVGKGGRRSTKVDGVRLLVSRIIWAWMTGEWPEHEVDHEDTDPGNDRWSNLREATHRQNLGNRKAAKHNRQGLKGVGLHKPTGLYTAACAGKRLGYFKTPEAAHEAYVTAARETFGEFARAR